MLAKVKDVKVGVEIEDEWNHDSFADGMYAKIGLNIKVEKKIDENGLTYKRWYKDKDGFNYHESWLEFIKQ
jgi:hypothetical protein